jgi:thymidine kinase
MTGRLELITGTMFAGKTTELIRRVSERGGIAYQHEFDCRFALGQLNTHDRRERLNARIAHHAEDISNDVIDSRWTSGACAGIDEAHFYETHALLDTVQMMLSKGMIVIAAGLEFDYRGVPLRPTAALARIADSITILRGRCKHCGDIAPYQRCITGQVVNGTAADYEPVCEHHLRHPPETPG